MKNKTNKQKRLLGKRRNKKEQAKNIKNKNTRK